MIGRYYLGISYDTEAGLNIVTPWHVFLRRHTVSQLFDVTELLNPHKVKLPYCANINNSALEVFTH